MKPEEKAKELVSKFLESQSNTEEVYDAEHCALISAQVTIDALYKICD